MTRKLTPKEEQATFRAAGRMYAKLFDKPVQPMDQEPVKRPAVFRSARDRIPHRGEADVQREILALLHRHPKVAMVKRINSGAMQAERGYIRFNRVRVKGQRDVRMVDIECLLKNGKTFAIEVKEPDWKPPDWAMKEKLDGLLSEHTARELGQKRYLDQITSTGGIGMFVTDAQQVIDALSAV